MTATPADKNDKKSENAPVTTNVTTNLPYGESVLRLTFGKAVRGFGMDQNYETNLIYNCTQHISQGVVNASPDVIAVAGRIERTPDEVLEGVMVFYRPTPEEWKDVPKLQTKVDGIFHRWTAPAP